MNSCGSNHFVPLKKCKNRTFFFFMASDLPRSTRANEKWRAKFEGEIKSQHLSQLSKHNVAYGTSDNPY